MHSSHKYGRTVRQSNLQPKLWGSFIFSVNTHSPTPHVLPTAWPWMLLFLQPGPREKQHFLGSLRGSPALCSPITWGYCPRFKPLEILKRSQLLTHSIESFIFHFFPCILRWRILWTIWANNLSPVLTRLKAAAFCGVSGQSHWEAVTWVFFGSGLQFSTLMKVFLLLASTRPIWGLVCFSR